jgi:hypothetical protein
MTTVDQAAPVDAALDKRILLVAEDTCATRCLAERLASGRGIVTRTGVRDDDLFAKALGHDSLVYLPAKSFLEPSRLEAPKVEEVFIAATRSVIGARTERRK